VGRGGLAQSSGLDLSTMNFGGPPFGNGPPPAGGMGLFPGGFPMVPNMQTAMPGMVPGAAVPVAYPQGQGPLAGRTARMGANGLYEAPEQEGPEVHGMLVAYTLLLHLSACHMVR